MLAQRNLPGKYAIAWLFGAARDPSGQIVECLDPVSSDRLVEEQIGLADREFALDQVGPLLGQIGLGQGDGEGIEISLLLVGLDDQMSGELPQGRLEASSFHESLPLED